MTDLNEVLPDFDLQPYRHLIHSLEKNDITVSELVSLDSIEIAKRCPLPLGDLKSMVHEVVKALQQGVASKTEPKNTRSFLSASKSYVGDEGSEKKAPDTALVRTLDPVLDECLGGGIRPGHLTEVVGESAVGKTQFVLGLLLSVQLDPPQGLGKSAIYLSTEAQLNTVRLRQMLQSHPVYQNLDPLELPSLDHIHTIGAKDLETQEHIVHHQLPLAIQRLGVGLVIIDSVAANFRAEHETKHALGLAERAVDLTKLGHLLRKLAQECNVAIVVTNQVSDRFEDLRTFHDRIRSSSPAMHSSPASTMRPPQSTSDFPSDIEMSLDHQQNFFTGWGDRRSKFAEQLKTPALGLSWTNQLSARIVLKMDNDRVDQHLSDYLGANIWKDRKKRRYLGLVFAPWAPSSLSLVEFEITSQGVISKTGITDEKDELTGKDMLDPRLWFDGTAEDEEFP